jgi:hypothetical protein
LEKLVFNPTLMQQPALKDFTAIITKAAYLDVLMDCAPTCS